MNSTKSYAEAEVSELKNELRIMQMEVERLRTENEAKSELAADMAKQLEDTRTELEDMKDEVSYFADKYYMLQVEIHESGQR